MTRSKLMRCGAESRSPSGAPSANLSLFMCVEIVKRVSVVIAVKTAMGFELKQDSSLWFGTDIFRLSFLCLLSMSLNAQDQPLGITASHLRFACEWLGASSPRFHKVLRLFEPHPGTFPNDFYCVDFHPSLKQFSCFLFPIGLLRRLQRVMAPGRRGTDRFLSKSVGDEVEEKLERSRAVVYHLTLTECSGQARERNAIDINKDSCVWFHAAQCIAEKAIPFVPNPFGVKIICRSSHGDKNSGGVQSLIDSPFVVGYAESLQRDVAEKDTEIPRN